MILGGKGDGDVTTADPEEKDASSPALPQQRQSAPTE
jgi:hypothetical protein